MEVVDVVEIVRSLAESRGEVGSRSQSECLKSTEPYSRPYSKYISVNPACICGISDLDQRLLPEHACDEMHTVNDHLPTLLDRDDIGISHSRTWTSPSATSYGKISSTVA